MSGEVGPQFWEGGASRLCPAAGDPEVLSLIYHSCDLTVFPDSGPSRFFSKPSLRSRNTIFTLGTRGSVISPTELEAPILVPHTAQRGEQRVRGKTSFRHELGAEMGGPGLCGEVRVSRRLKGTRGERLTEGSDVS